MIDEVITTGPVTRVRVVDVADEQAAGELALGHLSQGLGDWDEVVMLEEGVFEVVISNGY